MNELHLFAGAGGGILAGQLLGHRCVCAVEWEPYAQAVLVARQNDGAFPPFPIWDDVQTFDGKPWRGIIDIVAGGFPCQDISAAGKGAGIDGERSGMWTHMARIIGEVRPHYVFVENSPVLTSRGLGRVLGDLAEMGFDAQWGVLGASDVGAPHKRERIWIVANARCGRRSEQGIGQVEQSRGAEVIGTGAISDAISQQPYRSGSRPEQDRSTESANSSSAYDLANPASIRPQRSNEPGSGWKGNTAWAHSEPSGADSGSRGQGMAYSHIHSLQRMEPQSQQGEHGRQTGLHGRAGSVQSWPADPADAPESGLGRVADGVAHRSHRIKAIGNGQVPRVAAAAFDILSNLHAG